jgi:hypothetical protein
VSSVHVNYVLERSVTTGAGRLLMLAIAARADDDGVAHLSYVKLAADTRMSVRSIRRLLLRENSPIPDDELMLCLGGAERGQKRRMTQYRITL